MKYISLCENHLFSKVYSANNRCTTKTVSVFVLADKHANRLRKENPLKEKINRVGIVSSKKLGGAVQRNRARRVIRRAFYEIEKQTPLLKGKLIVITAREALVSGSQLKKGAQTVKTADVRRDLAEKSAKLFMKEWTEHRHVHENYCANTGEGCNSGNSDKFYHWGALLCVIAMAEAGYIDGLGQPLDEEKGENHPRR